MIRLTVFVAGLTLLTSACGGTPTADKYADHAPDCYLEMEETELTYGTPSGDRIERPCSTPDPEDRGDNPVDDTCIVWTYKPEDSPYSIDYAAFVEQEDGSCEVQQHFDCVNDKPCRI
jgi:hypothetical protein